METYRESQNFQGWKRPQRSNPEDVCLSRRLNTLPSAEQVPLQRHSPWNWEQLSMKNYCVLQASKLIWNEAAEKPLPEIVWGFLSTWL